MQDQYACEIQERGEDTDNRGGDGLLNPELKNRGSDPGPGSSVIMRLRQRLFPLEAASHRKRLRNEHQRC